MNIDRKIRNKIRHFSPATLALVTALCLTIILLLEGDSVSGFTMNTSSIKPFSLLVTLQFKSVEHKEEFLELFAPIAAHCKAHEPGTLAYEALLSDKDPLQVLILERYRDKEKDYLQVHRSSQPFLEFRPKLQAMEKAGHVTISGHSYVDSGIGYI